MSVLKMYELSRRTCEDLRQLFLLTVDETVHPFIKDRRFYNNPPADFEDRAAQLITLLKERQGDHVEDLPRYCESVLLMLMPHDLKEDDRTYPITMRKEHQMGQQLLGCSMYPEYYDLLHRAMPVLYDVAGAVFDFQEGIQFRLDFQEAAGKLQGLSYKQ